MGTTIDSLELQIQSGSAGAVKGIDSLIGSLGQLKSATNGGAGLTVISKQITRLNDALGKVSPGSVSNLNSMAAGLKALSSIGNFKLSPAIATQITALGNAARSLEGVNFAPVTELATGLQPLSTIGKTNLGATVNQLSRFPGIAAQLGTVNFTGFSTQIQSLVSALVPLSSIGKSNLGTALNQLGKIPTITAQLQSVDMSAFAAQIQRVTAAVAPLATQMQKVSNGFNAFPAKIQKLVSSNTGLAASNTKAGKSFSFLGSGVMAAIAKLTLVLAVVKRVIRAIGDLYKETASYIEAVNLFSVTMGSAARAASEYALKVEELLGIDSKEWMQNQGVFQQMIKGFGVGSDKATIMSRNLTQLGYDLSSLYDIDVQSAMDKLQSAMSGQIKGMREFGVETSVAALQEYALSQGISKSVSNMTMAEKNILRYNLVMERTTNMHGDLGRTINSPANALRLLNAQWAQLKRQLGAIVSVIATAVVPVLRAVTKVITELAARIASLFGFNIGDYFASLDSASDVEFGYDEQLDSAADSAKKLKGLLAGFDQLNIIGQQKDDSSGGSGGGGGVGDMPLFDNSKWLEGIDTSAFDAMVEKIKGFFTDIKNLIPQETFDNLTAAFKNLSDAWNSFKSSKAAFEIVDFIKRLSALSADIFLTSLADAMNTLTGALSLIEDIFDGDWVGAWDSYLKTMEGMESLLTNPFKKIEEFFKTNWFEKIFEKVNLPPWLETMFTNMGTSCINGFLNKISGGVLGEGGIMDWAKRVYNTVASIFSPNSNSSGFGGLAASITKSFSTAWANIRAAWGGVGVWFKNLGDTLSTNFRTITTNIKGFFTGLWSGIKSTFSSVANWFKTSVTEPIGNFFKGAINVVIRALNSLIRGLNKVSFDLPQWEILGDLAGKHFGINIAPIPTLANGGLVNSGQLFMARENGITEMVGQFGNSSGVANNGQIIQGIAQGVSMANNEQNGLLREQNAFLREQNKLLTALLEKEGKVVFPHSVEAGRAVQKSLNMYNLAKGTL